MSFGQGMSDEDRNILSLFARVHDPSVAVFTEGSFVTLGEEERFSRNKYAYNEFPIESIRYCLEETSLSLSDIDLISYAWDATKYPTHMAKEFLELSREYDKNDRTVDWEKQQLESRTPERIRERIRFELREFEGETPPVEFVNHHKSHAVSAFHYSGFDSAAVLTVDGQGEELTTVGWEADQSGLRRAFEFKRPHSLGLFMMSMTAFLGFRPHGGEGKVMGLAPYGEPDEEVYETLERVLDISADGYRLDPSYVYYGEHSYHERFTDALVAELGEPRKRDGEITTFYQNVAYATQDFLEQALEVCSKRLLEETGQENLCLAGGVAYNCKANKHLRETLDLSEMFVQPVAGDNGIPLGAGLLGYDVTPSPDSVEDFTHVYYGWGPSENRIEEAVHGADVAVLSSERTDTHELVATKLANGNIVARYDGRMEIGPRALGNRSILADPRDDAMLENVNEVKRREDWRPFAPSMLDEYAEEYLLGDTSSPFMIQTHDVTEQGQEEIPAVVHVDGTTRPQVLKKPANPGYWDVIDRFRSRTGVPVVLNTSFNLSGQPIVRTPEQAIDTFQRSKIDFLQAGDYFVGPTA